MSIQSVWLLIKANKKYDIIYGESDGRQQKRLRLSKCFDSLRYLQSDLLKYNELTLKLIKFKSLKWMIRDPASIALSSQL